MFSELSFLLFGGLAIGCAIALVVQRHPLYCAISLIGVFLSLASLYVLLAAPFIAAVQVIVYAGAIMVLVVFVIMLLNVEEEERRHIRLRFLVPASVALAGVLIAEAAFTIYSVGTSTYDLPDATLSQVGVTSSIGTGLFTVYLLPFEITSLLLLMAIVGAMSLSRQGMISPTTRVVPGELSLAENVLNPRAGTSAIEINARTSLEAEAVYGEHPTRSDDEG